MTKISKYFFCGFLLLLSFLTFSQNETQKWCLGGNIGLDFSTSPPTTFTHASSFGGITANDGAGNILFYGRTQLYNAAHLPMANGAGLNVGWSVNSGLPVKQPGNSNIYYIFHPGVNGFLYSIVDMNLAAGAGSVTVKNFTLNTTVCDWRTAGVLHCNGRDVWIMGHEFQTDNYLAYLLTPNGISTTPVITAIGTTYTSTIGANAMKFSPSGKKLATCFHYPPAVEILDFNRSTGVLSNFYSLPVTLASPFDIEFSPDESKIYATMQFASFEEFDLCAGSPTNIAASEYIISPLSFTQKYTLQMSPDNKVYVSKGAMSQLGVIQSPNQYGPANNYIEPASLVAGGYYFPKFVSSYFYHPPKPSAFTYSMVLNSSCHKVYFNAPPNPASNCAQSNYSVTHLTWNFGDPSTGAADTSQFTNPTHVYSAAGTYTATLIFHYVCGADTLKKVISVTGPNINVASTPSACTGVGSATIFASGGTGPFTYSWVPSMITSSVANGLSSGIYYASLYDQGEACLMTTSVSLFFPATPVFSVQPASAIVCESNSATLIIQGNASTYSFYKDPVTPPTIGSVIVVSPSVSTVYTVIGSISTCSATSFATVIVKPIPVASITSLKPGFCLNESIKIWGSGGKTYSWKLPNGSMYHSDTLILLPAVSGSGIYTLSVSDLYGCSATTTKYIDVLPEPKGDIRADKTAGCPGFISTFSVSFQKGKTGRVLSWESSGNKLNTNVFEFPIQGMQYVYANILDSASGCKTKLEFPVSVNPIPVADFDWDPPSKILEMDAVQFRNLSSPDVIFSHWYFPENEMNLTGITDVSYQFNNYGKYPVALLVKNQWGCSDTTIKAVDIKLDFDIYVPNAFTPNSDGLNDVFLPLVHGAKSYQLDIFDRWGRLIFHSQDPVIGWDGTLKGNTCKSDIYTWKIRSTSIDQQTKELTGHVFLNL